MPRRNEQTTNESIERELTAVWLWGAHIPMPQQKGPFTCPVWSILRYVWLFTGAAPPHPNPTSCVWSSTAMFGTSWNLSFFFLPYRKWLSTLSRQMQCTHESSEEKCEAHVFVVFSGDEKRIVAALWRLSYHNSAYHWQFGERRALFCCRQCSWWWNQSKRADPWPWQSHEPRAVCSGRGFEWMHLSALVCAPGGRNARWIGFSPQRMTC